MRYSKYNVVIIGSGISGLFLANKLSKIKNFSDGILLITKNEIFSGSSSLAQGGMVAVIPEINKSDSVESHIKDTLKAGCGLNNLQTVEFVSKNSFLAAQELIAMGVEFDKSENNTLNFTLEGAHSHPRILHSQGDSTGRVIERVLSENIENCKNIDIYQNTMALELLVDAQNSCKGLICYDWLNDTYETVYSSNVVIATGGIGQLYEKTTNPAESTADGIALAISSNAKVDDMEFVQFHPTALYTENKDTMPLVSESCRGEGAKLVDINGEYFAKNYHHLAELAPRDIVSRFIIEQMQKTNSNYVNLDISQIGIEKFKKRFPTITSICINNDVDLESGLIPVVPCEHYFMGGIKTDLNSKTSINNLYAIGECANTGLHGANRLASNSLLECVVFANNLFEFFKKNQTLPPKKHGEKIKSIIDKYSDIDNSSDKFLEEISNLFKSLKHTMTTNAGIIRTKNSLNLALNDIFEIETSLNRLNASASKEKYELQNALLVSKKIVEASINRNESIGAHYRFDCISKTTNDIKNTEYKYEKLQIK